MRRLAMAGGVAALLVAGVVACESDLPEPEKGLRVVGQVTYGGTAHAMFARPGVVINLFTEFPPMSPPRGSLTIEGSDFATPHPFEVVGVPSGKYKIVVQVVDLALATTMGAPTGSYPSFCALLAPVANIEVKEGEPTIGIDVTVYDSGRDPCLGGPRVDAGAADAGPVDAGPTIIDAPIQFDAPPPPPDAPPSFDARPIDAAVTDAVPADA